MYFSLIFLNWLSGFVLIQSLLFGTMLMALCLKGNKPAFFLGIFVLFFSLNILPQSFQGGVEDLGWKLVLINSNVLVYPFFYFYVQMISNQEYVRLNYWMLFFGVVGLLMIFTLTNIGVNLNILFFEICCSVFTYCYCVYISILIIKIVNSNIVLDSRSFSENNKCLSWVKWFAYMYMCICLFNSLSYIISFSYSEVIIVLASIGVLFWVTFRGIVQKNIVLLAYEVTSRNLMSKDEAKQLLGVVKSYIEESSCYVNDKLTIVDLAKAVRVHPKRISYAINSVKGVHFNRYINFFRVNYAKILLKSKAVERLSIEGIGTKAGFHSKTTFYNAFKRVEGMTPAKYKMS